MTQTALALAPGRFWLMIAALAAAGMALVVPERWQMLLCFAVAGGLVATACLLWLLAHLHGRGQAAMQRQLAEFIAHDAAPSFTTDGDGSIGFQNHAAMARFGARGGQTLTQALSEVFANPAAVLFRLQGKAAALGAAHEDLVTRRGHARLAVHRVGAGGFLWRLEEMDEHANGARSGHTLSLPMLTASKNDTILYMNEAMLRLVGERVRALDRIFSELPLRSGEEHTIATASGVTRAVVAEVAASAGRREIYLLPSATGRTTASDPTSFDALPVALMRLAPDGLVLAANRTARALLGDVDANARFSELFEGLGRPLNDWLADALSGRADRRPEVLRARQSEREVFLQVSLARVVEDGRASLVAVLSDATQLKTLEAQFVQSQKMQAIGQLAGGVAHDFNNLLTAISGHCDLLMLRHDKGDPDFSDLSQISQNANRAASLVGQLLAFSRKQTLKPRIIDLRDTLSDLTHLLNRLVGEKVRLLLTHAPDLAPIRADKRQLEQVIMNLVVNARDAMPGGGEIRIETEALNLTAELTRDRATLSPGNYVVVRVIDEGIGIAPDKIAKIFEPFYTTKRAGEGTGLGLSTVYGIVKQTGGYVFCDSVVGSGTCFTLYFPAHDQLETEPEDIHEAPAPRATCGAQASVLLVEDEAPVRAFASRALKLRGYTVFEAETGEEALHILEDETLLIDVFLSDVIMPGMDGPSWVREALKARPATRVVFVSGYAEDVFTDGRPPVPGAVFLPKPFSLSELTETVSKQLRR
ncbi:MAG: response regulator [Rhodobacteraceae bacterium]|nr:response regulator [Paracoccaceae bacterium]